MIQVDLEHIIVLLGIPSAITGLFFWMLKGKIEKQEKERRERERADHEGFAGARLLARVWRSLNGLRFHIYLPFTLRVI